MLDGHHFPDGLAHLAVQARDILVVGDAIDDAIAARDAGARAVLFASGTHHRRDLLACGFPVVGELREILEFL